MNPPEPNDDSIDWELTTFEGNRQSQHQEFFALGFREKLQRLEEFAEIEALFASRRRASLKIDCDQDAIGNDDS